MADIDDPFKPSDPTVHRPRPGAGRRGSPDIARSRPAASSTVGAEASPAIAWDFLGTGPNGLVRAAGPLLLLIGHLRGALAPMDVAALRGHALDEIRRFEELARSAGVQHEVVLAARYALCAGLDEAVLSTPWGAQSEWAQHPLLVALHREAWGGEKFFEMAERVSQDPGRHIDLMELLYLCMAFGFAGKYQVLERGHERLAELQQDLYRKIRGHRGPPRSELSLRWRGLEDRRNPLVRYVPWWVVGSAVLAVLAITFALYYARLGSVTEPVHAALAKIGTESFAAAEAPPHEGPTLKQLLAPDVGSGALSVEEQGGRTVVTLLAQDLFASGSATANAEYDALLQRVGSALGRVPGRALVVGHTDDQPLRSLRYRNNFELSRERAVSIVQVLQRSIDNPARLGVNGVGSSEPKYLPESDPANRARNRRVEIIHVRGS